MLRAPAVAGSFYEASPQALERTVQALLHADPRLAPRPAIGLMAPHAAFQYSGRIAGRAYAQVEVPDVVVVLAPNHTGLGLPAAVGTAGEWRIPTGDVPVDRELADRLVRGSSDLAADDLAHAAEHAVEVHLPFLRAMNPDVRIVPICLRTMSYGMCEAIGLALAEAIKPFAERVLLVASSDMNHHEPARVAARKDRMALERVEELDPRGLYGTVVDHHVSMCGFVPTVAMLVAARKLGARYGEVVAYGTSAEVTGDPSSVVGYAGVLVTRQRRHHIVRALDGGEVADVPRRRSEPD
jgi:hypothetical protein